MAIRAASLDSRHIASLWGAKPTESPGGVSNVFINGDELPRCVVQTTTNTALTGTPTIQGVATAVGDKVLVVAQTAAAENGVYRVTGSGSAWERVSTNAEEWRVVVVTGGDTPAVWVMLNEATPDVGTDAITFDVLMYSTAVATKIAEHADDVASTTFLGHVKIDGTTIQMNGSNQIFAVPAITGSGDVGQAVMWTGTSSIGYTDQVYLSDGAGAVAVSTSARIGVGILQEGNYEALKIVRNGPGAAGYPTVLVDSQDAVDATPAVRIKKAGTGKGIESIHNSHGVAGSYVTSGSGTGSAVTAIEVAAESTGTPGAGFGLRHQWLLESATVAGRQAASMVVSWVTATDASRAARFTLYVADSGSSTREALRAEADGSAVRLGFFGAAAVTKRAAPTAENTSTVDTTYGTQERDVLNNVRTRLGEVISALQSLGLMN